MSDEPHLGAPGQEISSTHTSELDRISLDYWWLSVRCGHVDEVIARVREPFRYLDFGCGAGTLASHAIERFAPSEALGVDGTHDALRAALQRGVPVQYVDMREAFAKLTQAGAS